MDFISTKVVTDFLEKNAFGKCEFCNNYDMCKYVSSRKGSHKNCWQVKQFPIVDFDKDNNPTKILLKLCAENPDLPIVVCVDGEIVAGDDYAWWLGSIGSCTIDEYLIDDWYGDGCVRFRSDNDDDIIIEGIAERKYEGTDEDYDKAEKLLPTLWKKAIVVRVYSWEE